MRITGVIGFWLVVAWGVLLMGAFYGLNHLIQDPEPTITEEAAPLQDEIHWDTKKGKQ